MKASTPTIADFPAPRRPMWPGLLAWLAAWVLMVSLDGRLDLANLAMLLLLGSVVASFWVPLAWSLAGHAACVVAFNWAFVPPRGDFSVDLRQHALLLGALLVVHSIVTVLVSLQRVRTQQAREQARRAELLRRWADSLRDAADPLALAGDFCALLGELVDWPRHGACAVMLLRHAMPATDDDTAVLRHGPADADQAVGLWLCLRSGQALGPGATRQTDLPDWYLPLRGLLRQPQGARQVSLGAALVPDRRRGGDVDPALHGLAQLMADQYGAALERARALRQEQHAREQAQDQAMRSALLAAVSHDYRTPLATIMGAASSLVEQADRLDPATRARLAGRIVDEAGRLHRMTTNTLQLARLDSPGVRLACDWESAEELIGAAVGRARHSDAARRVHTRVNGPLPLLWCDAMLVSQLLDNLLDNAFKHAATGVEVMARTVDTHVVLSVRDRGPGVPPAWRERIFDAFERADRAHTPGMGVGLAVCRAVARAHGGELRLRARAHGGSSFEFWLPVREQPAVAPAGGGAP